MDEQNESDEKLGCNKQLNNTVNKLKQQHKSILNKQKTYHQVQSIPSPGHTGRICLTEFTRFVSETLYL